MADVLREREQEEVKELHLCDFCHFEHCACRACRGKDEDLKKKMNCLCTFTEEMNTCIMYMDTPRPEEEWKEGEISPFQKLCDRCYNHVCECRTCRGKENRCGDYPENGEPCPLKETYTTCTGSMKEEEVQRCY